MATSKYSTALGVSLSSPSPASLLPPPPTATAAAYIHSPPKKHVQSDMSLRLLLVLLPRPLVHSSYRRSMHPARAKSWNYAAPGLRASRLCTSIMYSSKKLNPRKMPLPTFQVLRSFTLYALGLCLWRRRDTSPRSNDLQLHVTRPTSSIHCDADPCFVGVTALSTVAPHCPSTLM